MTANSTQISGDHYKTKGAQHWDMVEQNHMGYLEGCATKYIIRWQRKDGLRDLEKAEHYVFKILEEYNVNGRDNPAIPSTELEFQWGKFCADTEVFYPENQICMNLMNWKNEIDLIKVLCLINKLIGAVTLKRSADKTATAKSEVKLPKKAKGKK